MTSKLALQNPVEIHFRNQFTNIFKPYEDDKTEWGLTIDFVLRVAVYIVILAFLGMIIVLLWKLLGTFDRTEHDMEQEIAANETNLLLPKEAIPITYGTGEEDIESGDCGSCSSSSSSMEDLFNEKFCVICYDRQRNCFFVPCAHFVTCDVCAKRISEGQNITCPICRSLVHKVRKFAS